MNDLTDREKRWKENVKQAVFQAKALRREIESFLQGKGVLMNLDRLITRLETATSYAEEHGILKED